MSDYLVIVESPAKAKTIKKYLGSKYSVMASMGHVRDLPKSQMGIDIENDFTPKYITIKGKATLINQLKKEAKDSKNVFLATDPDREGEAISWHLLNALKVDPAKAKRVVFNEITKTAVQNAIKNPREIDKNLVDAQQARRVLDRIVGYKLSPLLWRKIRKGLSAGRVQSVAVRIICDRENEINAFVPKEYWSITASLLQEESGIKFNASFYGELKKKIEIENEEQANEILNAIKNAKFVVSNVKKGQKKRQPSAPFITSTLQQEASRKLGYTGQKTMMAAQTLYEGVDIEGFGTVGLITYMRTDSTRIADEAQQQAKEYIQEKWGEKFLPSSPRVYKNKRNAQDAHEAIRPTNVSLSPDRVKASLRPEQYKVYKLIWERFVSSQMSSAELDTLQVDISADKYIFRSTGSKLRFAGFMVLYTEGTDTEKAEDDEQTLPELLEGDKLKDRSVTPKQHFTQPPARYTDATLVKALEEGGIGRPSTYAPITSTVLARGYVEREKRTLYPTELGMLVTDMMKEHFKDIVDLDFTAHMEEQLDDVEEGNREWVEIIRKFYQPFDIELQEADKVIEHIEIKPEETDIDCEKCGRKMIIREGRYGKFLACPGFPECRNTKPIFEEVEGVKCPKCGSKVMSKKSQKGKKYFGCENNPTCDFMSWDMPTEEVCTECGAMIMEKNFRGKKIKTCFNKDCPSHKKKPDKTKS